MQHYLGRPLVVVADLAGVGVIGGALAGYLPALASVFAIAWYMLQIWESKTGRQMRARWRAKKPL